MTSEAWGFIFVWVFWTIITWISGHCSGHRSGYRLGELTGILTAQKWAQDAEAIRLRMGLKPTPPSSQPDVPERGKQMKKYWTLEHALNPDTEANGRIRSSLARDVYLCSEADEVIADWEAYNKTQVDGYNELLGKLAARDRTIERLKELVEKAWIEGDDSAAGLGYGHGDFNESAAKKQLDSILSTHAEPTAPAAAPQR